MSTDPTTADRLAVLNEIVTDDLLNDSEHDLMTVLFAFRDVARPNGQLQIHVSDSRWARECRRWDDLGAERGPTTFRGLHVTANWTFKGVHVSVLAIAPAATGDAELDRLGLLNRLDAVGAARA